MTRSVVGRIALVLIALTAVAAAETIRPDALATVVESPSGADSQECRFTASGAEAPAMVAQPGCCDRGGGVCGCSSGRMRCCNGDVAACPCRSSSPLTLVSNRSGG